MSEKIYIDYDKCIGLLEDIKFIHSLDKNRYDQIKDILDGLLDDLKDCIFDHLEDDESERSDDENEYVEEDVCSDDEDECSDEDMYSDDSIEVD